MNETTTTLDLDKEYILSKAFPVFPECGIYFLIKDNEIVYVGKSIHLHRRLSNHRKAKDFDRAFFVECHKDDLNYLEKHFIRLFCPRLNKHLKPKLRVKKAVAEAAARKKADRAAQRAVEKAAKKAAKKAEIWKLIVEGERLHMDRTPWYADFVKKVRPSLYYEAYPEKEAARRQPDGS